MGVKYTMTFQQYIDNPLGRKNAVFSQREMFKEVYTKKWDAVFMREAGRLTYFLYYNKVADHWYAHIKIPSEVVPKFYYDVVIKFYTKNNALRVGNSLKDYDVEFFSNDPAFVFTYERVFHKNGMFIEELSPKASKMALKKDPNEKNPYGIPGYVKSIYFAWLFMKQANLFSKGQYTTSGNVYHAKNLMSNIEDTDKKIADRQREGERVARDKKAAEKIDRDLKKSASTSSIPSVHSSNQVNPGKIIGKVSSIKKIPSVKTAKSMIPRFSNKKG